MKKKVRRNTKASDQNELGLTIRRFISLLLRVDLINSGDRRGTDPCGRKGGPGRECHARGGAAGINEEANEGDQHPNRFLLNAFQEASGFFFTASPAKYLENEETRSEDNYDNPNDHAQPLEERAHPS